jgi:hypothetical protein
MPCLYEDLDCLSITASLHKIARANILKAIKELGSFQHHPVNTGWLGGNKAYVYKKEKPVA